MAMLTVAEALAAVLAHTVVGQATQVELDGALGQVLAQPVASDLDSPPWDKSMVDGFALRSADLAAGEAELTIVEEVMAGQVARREVGRGEATRIMTGAPLPRGADAVVMVERTELRGDAPLPRVRVVDTVRAGQNILRQGVAFRRGEVVLAAGTELLPAAIGLLAEVGAAQVWVIPPPRVAVLTTGNELVPVDAQPRAGEIRNSNLPMLSACIRRAGAVAVPLAPARDELLALRAAVEQGLEADVLVLSGGVSAGVLDLVPQVLGEAGVRQVFHKIRLKPGKPLWFGVAERQGAAKLVFGLPGNPVSSLVCFELFVRPALRRLAGYPPAAVASMRARLSKPFSHRGDRPTYHPAIYGANGEIEPLAWQGSADLRPLVAANALVHFPPGERSYGVGDSVEFLPL